VILPRIVFVVTVLTLAVVVWAALRTFPVKEEEEEEEDA
jgi:hypothetical protein